MKIAIIVLSVVSTLLWFILVASYIMVSSGADRKRLFANMGDECIEYIQFILELVGLVMLLTISTIGYVCLHFPLWMYITVVIAVLGTGIVVI